MNLKVKFDETDGRASADFGDFQVLQGPPGKDGKSAYEIAVEHGFVGTEEEWLESFPVGPQGENGATFTPYVDSNGNLSWSNDKGLPNPQTVKIKGADGKTPKRGTDYWTDADKAEIQSYVEDAILGGAW